MTPRWHRIVIGVGAVAIGASLTAGAQVVPTGIIQGVVRDDRGDAVPQAYVAVHRSRRRGSQSVLTNDAGRFVLRDVAEDQYLVTASKLGYLTTQYGQSDSSQSPRPIAVSSTAPRSIEIRIPRLGAIEGSVLDDRGRLAPGTITLSAVPSSTSGGPTQFTRSRGVFAPEGTFRADLVPPGTYVATTWSEDVPPFTATPVDATRIVVAPGERVRGVTVRVRPLLPAGRIAVSVVPPAHGWASPSAVVWLEYSDGFRAREVTGRDLAAATGAFEFDDLPPGRYAIVANNAPIIGRPGGTALPGGWATETVDVSPDGTTQSTLQLDRAVAISGRLAFDPLSSRTDLSTIGVSLVPISLPPPLARRLPGNVLDQTDFSGRFAVRNIPAGRYAIRIETAEGNWTATSVRLFGREVVDEPIEISTDLAAIEVTLFDRRSDLRGTVGTEDAAAQTARAVALFAKETRYWWPGSPRIRLAPIALGGTFEVDDLGPGTYLIAAGDFDPGEPWTEALLTSLRPLAAEIAIGRGERLIVDLQVRAGRTTASVKVPSGR